MTAAPASSTNNTKLPTISTRPAPPDAACGRERRGTMPARVRNARQITVHADIKRISAIQFGSRAATDVLLIAFAYSAGVSVGVTPTRGVRAVRRMSRFTNRHGGVDDRCACEQHQQHEVTDD